MIFSKTWTPDLEDNSVDQNDPAYDDDPQCTRCGIYRSEHAGLSQDCDGFTTQSPPPIIYTSSDLAEMSYDEIDDLFGCSNRYGDEEDEDDLTSWDPTGPAPIHLF